MVNFALKYQIGADNRQLKTAFQEVDRTIERTSQKGQSVFKGVFGGNVATQAFSQITSMLVDGGKAVLDYSAKLEQTKIGFSTLMGGASLATKHLEELKKISLGTGLEFLSLTKMSQRLQGAGLEAEKVVELVKDIGNTAAATGDLTVERMEGIGVAISQVFSKGKVSAEEMEQLAERGIPAWRILSQAIGKTVGETRKMAEDGEITSQMFLDAFQKFTRMNFGDAMEKQARTFTGAMGKITNILQVTASEAFKPIYEEISKFADKVARSFSEQEAETKQAGISFGRMIGTAIGVGIEQSGVFEYRTWSEMVTRLGADMGKQIGQFGRDIAKGARSGFETSQLDSDPLVQAFRNMEEATRNYSAAFRRLQSVRAGAATPGAVGDGKKKSGGRSGDDRTDKQVYQDFVRELEKLGVRITDGFRTTAQQAALYNRLPRGQAARPGTSDHEFYRGVDLPAGVSQDVLERAARAAGVTLDKPLFHQGTGYHRHQGFQKGRGTGGGEADLAAEAEAAKRFREEEEREQEDFFQNWLREERQAMEDRIAIREVEADLAETILEGYLKAGLISEEEYAERVGDLRIETLQQERDELAEQVSSRENIVRLQLLDLEIAKERAKKENEIADILRKQTEEYEKQVKELQKLHQDEHMQKRTRPDSRLRDATGAITSMDDVMKQLGQTAEDVFMQFGQGLGDMLGQWVLLGDQADISMKKMTASILAGVASQAATLAIFHVAMGIAALTPWGAAMYGPAPLHFKAAAVWGALAVGAALAGRAVAGDSFKNERGGGAGGGSSSSGSRQQELAPSSRFNDNTFVSGRRPKTMAEIAGLSRAVEKLEAKISSMRPGEVLTTGIKQKPGVIGNAYNNDVSRNSSIGARTQRLQGGR